MGGGDGDGGSLKNELYKFSIRTKMGVEKEPVLDTDYLRLCLAQENIFINVKLTGLVFQKKLKWN